MLLMSRDRYNAHKPNLLTSHDQCNAQTILVMSHDQYDAHKLFCCCQVITSMHINNTADVT